MRQTYNGNQLLRSYKFEGLEVGREYPLTVTSKRYRFATRTVNLTEHLSDVHLVGLE